MQTIYNIQYIRIFGFIFSPNGASCLLGKISETRDASVTTSPKLGPALMVPATSQRLLAVFLQMELIGLMQPWRLTFSEMKLIFEIEIKGVGCLTRIVLHCKPWTK